MEWFRHDVNMENDEAVSELMDRYGLEGLGAYIHVLHLMYDNDGKIRISRIQKNLQKLLKKKFQGVYSLFIKEKLFFENGEYLFSRRVNEEFERNKFLRDKKIEAGKKGAERRWQNHSTAITEPEQNYSSTNGTAIADPMAKNGTNVRTNIDNSPLCTLKGTSPPSLEEGGVPQKRAPAFKKPTVEDVKAYCQERENGVDPQAFCDFYESKGWKVGSSPMKDWKAAVRTWEQREKSSGSPTSGKGQRTNMMVESMADRIRMNKVDIRTGLPIQEG